MKSIWLKLAAVVMLISVSGILVITLLSIEEMDHHFSMYLHDFQEDRQVKLVQLLSQSYREAGGWHPSGFALIEGWAEALDYSLRLYDVDQQIVWQSVRSDGPSVAGSVPSPYIPIQVDQQVVGYFTFQLLEGASTLTLQEHFQTAHTSAMLWTLLFLMIVIGILSLFLSRKIVVPILQIQKASLQASQGDLRVQVPLPKGEDELTQVVQAFNQFVMTLDEQDKLRKRLTSDISHELRTPVNTLLIQAEGMIDGIWGANPENIEAMRTEIIRLSRIIEDLDQANRVEAGVMPLQAERFELSQMVWEVVRSMTPTFQRQEVRLASQIDSEMELVGDRQRLAQVIINLLDNARKHTPAGGSVSLILESDKDVAVLKVVDTGIGIPEADLPHVFERFYRSDVSRQRKTGGTGLGLTIVKGIVDAHGGNIQITSKKGQGTDVTVRLPLSSTPHPTLR